MARMLKSICVQSSTCFASQVAPEDARTEEIAASCAEWMNSRWLPSELRPSASDLLVRNLILVTSCKVHQRLILLMSLCSVKDRAIIREKQISKSPIQWPDNLK